MVSVGIYMPCYNVEKYIIDSVKSIENQTFENWELIIMDDCSEDNTYNVISEYLDIIKKPNIKIFKREKHCGYIGKVKNECIKKLNNPEFICHVGSDDIIPDYCLQVFIEFMNNNKQIGAAYGNFICFDDKDNKWTFPHVANSGDFDSNILLKYMTLFPHRFYRYETVKNAGFYSEELTSAVDYDLALKIDEIVKIKRIKEPVTYYYRQHSQQVSTKNRPEQDMNAKKALENALKRRNIDAIVKNDKPPFILEKTEKNHFIWGKK